MEINEEKKPFRKIEANGYDPIEVDAYIAELEKQLMNQHKNDLPQTNNNNLSSDFLTEFETMKKELRNYKEIEDKLKGALRAAHKATENIQHIVENESRRILYEANKNADEIIAEALDQAIIALKYIKKMRTNARVFQKRFEVFIAAQNQFIDNNIWNEILAPIDSYEFIDIASIDDIKKIEKKLEDVEEKE